MTWQTTIILTITCLPIANTANILAICTVVSHSHSLWCYQFMNALIEQGHQVTVFGLDKPRKQTANLTTFIAEGVYNVTYNTELTDRFTNSRSVVNLMTKALVMQHKLSTPIILHSKAFKELLKKYENVKRPFDVIIHDHLMCFACMGLVHHFGNPPLILATTYGLPELWMFDIGNFPNPAYVPNMLLPYSQQMTFYEKVFNTFTNVLLYYVYKYEVIPFNDELMKKVFKSDIPSVVDIAKRASIIMGNYFFTMDGARPLPPGVVAIPGLHINKPQLLPQKLKHFMDTAHSGVILISFGTNINKNWLPDNVEETIMKAFQDFPQKVLWKWERIPSELPSNMHVVKWLPQVDVLAHPNMRLFVSHSGLLSCQEAIIHGIPLLLMPVFFDQHAIAERLHQAGVSLTEDIFTVTSSQLTQTAFELLQNSQYKTTTEKIGKLMRDTPLTAQQQAVYWTEYAVRHDGASHLRSVAVDMPWYRILLLDMLAALITLVLTFIWLVKASVYFLLRSLTNFKTKTD